MATQTSKVFVDWLGQNIAPYLYGHSPRILCPGKEFVEWDDRIALKQALAGIRPSDELFGVRLSPVTTASDFAVGRKYLMLEDKGGSYSKTIIQVSWAGDMNGAHCVEFRCVWPSWEKGHSGGFVTRFYTDDKYGEQIILKYRGPLPEEDHAESFFAKVMSLAQDFSVLEMLWMQINSQVSPGTRSMEPWWPDEFAAQHPEFRRTAPDVWTHLRQVRELNSLRGINRVYDDRLMNRNFIAPILSAMQADILQALWQRPDIADTFFAEDMRQFWGRYLEVLFEKYYLGKSVIIHPNPASPKTEEQTDGQRQTRVLKTIIKILERKDTTNPHYYQAALYYYNRLTGQPYTG